MVFMPKKSEILVLGATHGNEPFGKALVESLEANSVDGVDQVIANEAAAALGVRYIDTNLNWRTSPEDNTYEGQRLQWLIGRCANAKMILDMHNAKNSDRRELWLHQPTEETKAVARWILDRTGIRHVVEGSENLPFYRHLPQDVTVELGIPDDNDYPEWEKDQLGVWREIVTEIAKVGIRHLDASLHPDTVFVKMVTEPTREVAKRAGLDELPRFATYDPLPAEAAQALGLPADSSYRVQSSHYHNSSRIIPGTGEREIWGAIVKDIDPIL